MKKNRKNGKGGKKDFPQKKKKIKGSGFLITGTLHKNRKGFGFVVQDIPEDADPKEYPLTDDIFVSGDNMKGAMNGDKVEVDLIPSYLWGNSPEGIIHRILDRNFTEVAGVFDRSKKFGFVIPESKKLREDVFVSRKNFGKAKKGDYVVCEITKYPDGKNKAEGRIKEIIARKDEPGGDILALAKGAGLDLKFPSAVKKEASAVSDVISDDELRRRRDLRSWWTVTIDGKDSKDFDDAVSVTVNDRGNYVLGVHIADVAHYVKDGSELDREAAERGNSVYLLNKVIPMLPEKLSNGICSLNPEEDRLALTCLMEIDDKGKVVDHEIFESVIRSKARLVYDDVSDILEKGARTERTENLFLMGELAGILRNRKEKRGSVDFRVEEPVITLDHNGHAVDVSPGQRRTANRMIEEFMLLANETVAEHFFWMNIPFVYRVHEKPSAENVEDLRNFLKSFGILLRGDASEIRPDAFCRVLEQAEGKTYENLVNKVVLRSMQKADYRTECGGHFGLALRYYCHFTSPIRRYPDLMIHRIIKMILRNEMDEKAMKRMGEVCEKAAEHSSATERAAVELEREADKMKMTEYMEQHTGEKFDGIISGVTGFGFYVELACGIEGLVRFESLRDDYYEFDPDHYRVTGTGKGKTYTLGDPVRIKVINADVRNREIDFILAK